MDIAKYRPRWQRAVNRLADEVFGHGYFAKPSEIAREPDSCMYLSLADDETVVGFAYGRVLPAGGLRDHLGQVPLEVPRELDEADAAGCLGAILTIAVARDHRGMGLGTTLIHTVHDTLVGLGADKLIATFKRGPREGDVDRMMRRLKFDPWVRLPSFWKERCEERSFECVSRENGCTCEAVFYRKAVY